MSGPRSNRSAKAPAGNAKRSQGKLFAATTAETASGLGSTTTAIRGIAPNISPSPPLARVNPAHSRKKGRPSGFLRMRCLARDRVLTDATAGRGPTNCQTLAWMPAWSPLVFWRDNGGCRLSVNLIR